MAIFAMFLAASSKKIAALSLYLLTAALATLISQAAFAIQFEGKKSFAGPTHGNDQVIFDRALERAKLRSDKLRLLRQATAQATPHDVVLTWPLREAVSVVDPSVQAISNFADQDPAEGENAIEDWNCGGVSVARTYDGHRGTDIFTAPFSWYFMEQDAAIVVAAAPGLIIDKVQDQPERSCTIDNSGGENNLLVIEHADGSWAIYAHMRTNSLTGKEIGDLVERGEYLGVVGSSGYSTGPHLHFEVGFFENGAWQQQDPFAGQCNALNTAGWWGNQPEYYETSLISIATHAAAPEFPACPETEVPHYQDSFSGGELVVLSLSLRDLLPDRVAQVQVVRPNGTLAVSTTYSDSAIDHEPFQIAWFNFQLPINAITGAWEYRVTFEGRTLSKTFYVDSGPPVRPPIPDSNNAYNGLWYDPDLSGEGYNIVTTGNGTVIYFYGSDQGGKRLWLVSELIPDGFADGEEKNIVMYESTGGTFALPVPSSRGLSIWGELALNFTDCQTGTAMLSGEDGTKTSDLVKLAGVPGSNCTSTTRKETSAYAGLWYDPSLPGEGFNLVVANPGSVLYYYGFDKDGNRLWLVTAPYEFDYAPGETIIVQLLRATAGTFSNPVADALEAWGTLEIRGDSCDLMELTLNTNDGDKFMLAHRLVSVVGLGCD